MQEITISMERFVELVEKEVAVKAVEKRVAKGSDYLSRADILALLNIDVKDETDV